MNKWTLKEAGDDCELGNFGLLVVGVDDDGRRPVQLDGVDVQRDNVDGTAEQRAQVGLRPAKVAVHKLLDVRAGLRLELEDEVVRVVRQQHGAHLVYRPRPVR